MNFSPLQRRKSRELALQILFQTEFEAAVSLDDLLALFEERISPDVLSYAQFLIHGIQNKKAELDQVIQAASQHWKVSRMSLVDRNIIRIAVFEMKFSNDPVKPNIAINEAIEIAKKYGTTESGAFVNGLLDQMAKGL